VATSSVRAGVLLLLAACCALPAAGGCTEYYTLDLPDVNIEQPDDLPQRLAAYRSGSEKWHGDPKAVADIAIRRHLNVPWSPEPFRPSQYEVKESPEWGTYVVRGYVYPSGHLMRYRVKVRPYKEIWYAVQISHYKMHTIDEDSAHPLEH
jgi:hypothetical protein